MKLKALFSIFILGLLLSPVISSLGAQEVEYIGHTDDDGFITEVGNWVTTAPYTVMTDPGMDISSWFTFRDIDLQHWWTITNATLRLRTTQPQDFESGASVTLRAIDDPDFFFSVGQTDRYPTGSEIRSAPKTSQHVNINTSALYGAQFHEIEVTQIVRHLVNDHADWDSGDTIGFYIASVEGETRQIVDYSYGQSQWYAQLNITYAFTPPAPPTGYEYVNSSRGYQIWILPGSRWLKFSQYTQVGTDITVYNDTHYQYFDVDGNDNERLYLNTTEEFGGIPTWVDVKVGHNVTWYQDTSPGASRFNHALFAWTDHTTEPMDLYTDFIAVRTVSGSTGNTFWWQFYALEGGAGATLQTIGGTLTAPDTKWWWIRLNATNNWYNVTAYHDFEMTNKYASVQGTYRAGVNDHLFDIEFAFGTVDPTYSPVDWADGWGLSSNVTEVQGWLVTDENGSTVQTFPGDTEIDDIYDWIDEYLGYDPHDPEPPTWENEPVSRFQTRLYFLIVGSCCFFGPFFVIMYWGRSTSARALSAGIIIMLIGLGLLIHITQI